MSDTEQEKSPATLLRESSNCLYLEVPGSIADDVKAKVDAVLSELADVEQRLETAMKQNRKQDTALRILRHRLLPLMETLDSSLKAEGGLIVDGQELDVDQMIADALLLEGNLGKEPT